MLKQLLISVILTACIAATGKARQQLQTGILYKDLGLQKKDTLRYGLQLKKGGIFQFAIEQHGIALVYELTDASQQVKMKSRPPMDINGF